MQSFDIRNCPRCVPTAGVMFTLVCGDSVQCSQEEWRRFAWKWEIEKYSLYIVICDTYSFWVLIKLFFRFKLYSIKICIRSYSNERWTVRMSWCRAGAALDCYKMSLRGSESELRCHQLLAGAVHHNCRAPGPLANIINHKVKDKNFDSFTFSLVTRFWLDSWLRYGLWLAEKREKRPDVTNCRFWIHGLWSLIQTNVLFYNLL